MVVTTDSSATVAVASMRLAFAKTFRASSAARRATLGEHSRAARIVFTCIVASDASKEGGGSEIRAGWEVGTRETL